MDIGKVLTDINYRERIDDEVLNGLKAKIYKYLCSNSIPNSQVFWQNMQKVSGLYVENLKEKWDARMQSRPSYVDKKTGRVYKNEIAIDQIFMKYDKDGNLIGFDEILKDLILSQLGHELIHSAARYLNQDNFPCTGLFKDEESSAMNEGFTQLFTEDIFGLPVSPHTDLYTDLKKIAKILQNTFGKQQVLNAYFNHDGSLESACNKIANNQYFYSKLCIMMNNSILTRTQARKAKTMQSSFLELSKKYRDMSYRSVVLNIIIPKIRSKSPEEQRQYIRSIMDSVKDNSEVSRKMKAMIKRYSLFNRDEIESEIFKLNRVFEAYNKILDYYTQVAGDNLWSTYMTIDSEGNAHPKIRESATLRGSVEETAFSKMFMQVRGIYRVDDNGNKIIDEDKLNGFKEYVNRFLRNGRGQAPLKFKPEDSIITRKSYMAALKTMAALNDYIILNSINECNNQCGTTLEFIRQPGKNHAVTFDELHKIYSKFQLISDKNEDGAVEFKQFSRATKEVVPDKSIQIMTQFADLWVWAFTNIKDASRSNLSIEKFAFSAGAKFVFERLGTIISKQLNETRPAGHKKNS